jgi:hypothetical protein
MGWRWRGPRTMRPVGHVRTGPAVPQPWPFFLFLFILFLLFLAELGFELRTLQL